MNFRDVLFIAAAFLPIAILAPDDRHYEAAWSEPPVTMDDLRRAPPTTAADVAEVGRIIERMRSI